MYGLVNKAIEELGNLPSFHTRVQMISPNLAPPRFKCLDIETTSMSLHHHTRHPSLTDFFMGLMQRPGRLCKTPATAKIFALNWTLPAA